MIHNNIEKENWGEFDEGEGISLERKKIIIDIFVTFVLKLRLKNFWTKNRTEEERKKRKKKVEKIFTCQFGRNYSCLHRRNGVKHIRSPSNLWKKCILEIVISDIHGDTDATYINIAEGKRIFFSPFPFFRVGKRIQYRRD